MTNTSTNPNSRAALPNATRPTLVWLAFIVTLIAVGVHYYLLSEHLDLRYGEASASSICNINATFNCAAVSASQYSEIWSYPVALLGMAANLFLLILIGWYSLADAETENTARSSVLTLVTFIALTSVVMGAISSLILQRYCPFCMLAYLLSFIAAAALWKGLKRKPSGVFGRGLAVPVVTGLIVLLGIKIANDQTRDRYKSDDLGRYAKEKVQEWSTAPVSPLLTLEPLVEGAAKDKAKMTIVEFADFRCTHCKHAAPVLHAFVSAHPDTRLEFLAWPLDGECNRAISRSDGASCLLARAVYCAQKEGGNGWAAHSYTYEHQEDMVSVDVIKGRLADIAQAAGVPSEKLIACSDSAATKTMIEKQAAIGTELKLGGTPTVYVNGKKLEGGQVMQVLSEAYKTL